MKSFTKSIPVFLLALFATIAVSTHAYSAGIPAGAIITDSSYNMTVVGLNFNSSYTKAEAQSAFETAAELLELLGGNTNIDLYSPDELMGYGLDGDSLHSLLVANISSFDAYIQVTVSKLSSGTINRFDAFEWVADRTQGTYMGSLEAPKSLPLMSLLSFLSPGTNCIKVVTSSSSNSYGKITRWDTYVQTNCTGTGDFMAAIELSDDYLKSLLN